MTYFDEIMEMAKTDLYGAATELTKGLMRGDPASLKQGYGLGSALIAAAERFSLKPDEVAIVADRVAVANFESNGPSAPPQVYAYLTEGGLIEAYVTRGTVDLIVVDWDEVARNDEYDLVELREELERIPEGVVRFTALNDLTDMEQRRTNWPVDHAEGE